MKRDLELKRLIKYAQGMGVEVKFKPYVRGSGNAAEWRLDGSEITIYTTKRNSKIYNILLLIHELGHHKSFILNGRKSPSEEYDIFSPSDDKSKKFRRQMYLTEKRDSRHWETIYKDTGCTFPVRILKLQRDYDLWVYHYFYKNGVWPSNKERGAYRAKLRSKRRE